MSDSVEIADYILVLGGETRTPIGQSIIGKGGMSFPDWFASGFVTSGLKDQRSARVSGVPRKEKKVFACLRHKKKRGDPEKENCDLAKSPSRELGGPSK